MKFIVEYPVVSTPGAGWLEPASITRFARAAEEAGLDGIGFTDHPAPSLKWLNGGGHETFDPFAALAFCAAVTTRIRLLTWLSVVPYRNPFLAAKSMTTVDLLSGGRATFALGSGYLRSEFAALGVDFEERNDLFEESVQVMKAAWTGDEVSFEGLALQGRRPGGHAAPGAAAAPAAVDRRELRRGPGPGGPAGAGMGSDARLEGAGSHRPDARDRVHRGSGGAHRGPDPAARRSRAQPEGDRHRGRRHGGSLTSEMSADQRLESFAEIERIGVTVASVQVPRDSVHAAIDALARFGADVLGQ